MKRSLGKQAEQYRTSNKRKKLGYRVLWCLGAVVVFCTTYALILPAITMENEYLCGMEEHVHDESCWVSEIIGPEPQLVCGEDYAQADIVFHIHDDFCYDQEGNLICELEEQENHIHDESCYQETRVLICQEEGIEPEELDEPEEAPSEPVYHQHDESCYQESEPYLICELEENEEHTHTEECYQTDLELVCGMEEGQPEEGQPEETSEDQPDPLEGVHVHTDECYEITKELICEEESYILHEHDETCYDEEDNLICELPVVVEHQHDENCIIYSEPREVMVYGCGKEPHIHTDECYVELRPAPSPCGFTEHIHTEDCYFPDTGELRCTMPEHIHDESCQEVQRDEQEIYTETRAIQLVDSRYSVEIGGFQATFQVNGEATVTVEVDPPEIPEGSENTFNSVDPENDGSENDNEPPAEAGEQPMVAQDPREPAMTETPESQPDIFMPDELETPGAFDSQIQENGEPSGGETFDEGYDAPLYTEDENQEDFRREEEWTQDDIEYQVELLDEDDEGYQDFLDQSPEPDGEQEPMMLQVLSLKGQIGKTEIDFSQCEVTVTVTPTQDFLEALENVESEQNTMTIDDLADYFNESEVVGLASEDVIIPLEKDLTTEPADEQSDNVSDEDGEIDNSIDRSINAEIANLDGTEPIMENMDMQPVYTMAVMNASGQRSATEVAPDSQVSTTAENGTVGVEVNRQVNPQFTVQYYAYLKTVDTSADGKTGMAKLPVIDTEKDGLGSGKGILPTNGSGNDRPAGTKERYLYLDSNGNVKTTGEDVVQPIYRSHKFEYAKSPGLQYVNIVAEKPDNQYTIDAIWVLKEGCKPDSTNPADWEIYPYQEGMRITNRKQTVEEGQKGMYVYISDQAVIRLVYDTKSSEQFYGAKFYDYDISDGEHTVSGDVTTMKTNQQGINSTGNYTGSGAKYAFGNANTGMGRDDQEWEKDGKNNKINKFNRDGTWDKPITISYKGCTFGLVTGATFNADGTPSNPIFAEGVTAPNLFDGDAVGKSFVSELTGLNFIREGDTFTLTSVQGADNYAKDLESFGNPSCDVLNDKGVVEHKTYTDIWTNNFWPMDVHKGKDIHFGASKKAGNWKKQMFSGKSSGSLPLADDGKDHNSYFGMTFAIDFDLTSDYIGPLEYYFFGDDDMWVVLSKYDQETGKWSSGQLVCDIGGVHSAVGEYVNLWDYIKKTDTTATTEDATTTRYRLSFFYTERGASGSTCWMQFTLPTVVGVDLEHEMEEKLDANTGALTIGKEVQGNDTTQEFKFTLELEGVDDDYEMVIKRKTNSGEWEDVEVVSKGRNEFTLRHDERLYITKLPAGAKYTITELIDESPGYSPSHVTTTTNRDANGDGIADVEPTITVGESVLGEVAQGTINGFTSIKVLYTNYTSYVLPETGGEGLVWYYVTGGGMMLLAAAGQLSRHKKTKGEGADE